MTYPYRRGDAPGSATPAVPSPSHSSGPTWKLVGATVAAVTIILGLVAYILWPAPPSDTVAVSGSSVIPPVSSSRSTPESEPASQDPTPTLSATLPPPAPLPPPAETTTVTKTLSPSFTATPQHETAPPQVSTAPQISTSPSPPAPTPQSSTSSSTRIPPSTANIVLEVSGGRGARIGRVTMSDGRVSGGSGVYDLPFTHTSVVTVPHDVRISVEYVKDGVLDRGQRPLFYCRISQGGRTLAEKRGLGFASCYATVK